MSDPTLALLIALTVTMLIAVVLGYVCVVLSRRISRMCAAWRECGAPEFAPAIKKLDGELFDARTANASLAADARRLTDENTELRGLYNLALRAVPVAGDRGHVATAGEADDVFNGQAWRKQ